MTAAANTPASAPVTIDAQAFAMRWQALGQAGAVVAALAGVEGEGADEQLREFPNRLSATDGWRQRLAHSSCAELVAVMEPGITALLEVNGRGSDCRPAALALWNEFTAARQAMLALLPVGHAQA